jgi:hypothetical protein
MRKVHHLALGLSAFALSGMALSAQEINYGGQISAALPAGPLSSKEWQDGQFGGGGGVHMVIGFQGGHAIVPRFDYTYFKKSESGVDRKVQMYQIGADYNYFLSGKVNEGPYLGAGAGFGSAKFELTGYGYAASDTPNTAYGAVAGGWMFTKNMGTELRYTWSRYKPELNNFAPRGYMGKQTVDSPTINASFIFRF